MVLFSFITPQFESGAQSEVTMLRPDSRSSCLPARRCSRNLPLSGQACPLIVCTLIGTHAGRRAGGKPTMQFKDKQQNKTGTASQLPRVPFACLHGRVSCVHSGPHECGPARPRPDLGAGPSQLRQDVPGLSSPHEEGPLPPPRLHQIEKNGQSRQL